MQINGVAVPALNNIQGLNNFKTQLDPKFTLINSIDESELQEKLKEMLEKITEQGNKITKHMDIRDVKIYRSLIAEFFNEVVAGNYKFHRESYLDRRGKHRVYGIIHQANKKLDELARELLKEEKNAIAILEKVGEIQGLLLDIET